MLKLEQVKRRPEESEDCLREKAAALLRIPPEEILSLTVLRRAVDARPPICLVYTLAVEVKNEGAVLRRSRCRQASLYLPQRYTFTGTESAPNWHQTAPNVLPPVVVGAGPAGLFAALTLARAGASLWSRGKRMWKIFGPVGLFFPTPMCSLARAAPGLFPTGS